MRKKDLVRIGMVLLLAGCTVQKQEASLPSPAPEASPAPSAEVTPVPTPEPQPTAEPAGISYGEFLEEHEAIGGSQTHEVFELPLDTEGKHIYGWLYLPVLEGEKCPLVILCHGFQGNYQDVSKYTGYFVDAGIAVYIFDFCGGSTYSSSSGDFLHMSVITEKEDLNAVYEKLCADYAFVDRDHVFLMGESQGGLAAALQAGERPETAAGLILFYPAFSIPDMARKYNEGGLPEVPQAFRVPVGQQYYLDVLDLDVWEAIAPYRGPVRIMHGSADVIIPLSYSEQAEQVYENAELTVYPGEGHGFSDAVTAEVCRNARDFVLAQSGMAGH